MKPKQPNNAPDLFRSQLSQILNMDHKLVRLADRINWDNLASKIDVVYHNRSGQPPLPTRLLVGLHYLKALFNESDENVVERWVENPYWQYFCGFEYLQHELPLHPTSLVKWRQRVGEGLESLLTETIELARSTKAMSPRSLDHVNVDTTVQEKAIAFPTDARLYQSMRIALVRLAKKRGIALRQNYVRVGKRAYARQNRYAHARQMKRARRECRKLKTFLGRVVRDILRKYPEPDEALALELAKAQRLLVQQRHDKHKLYSIHAPEVECIAKGKAHKRYEFGNKVSFVTTSKDNWIVGVQSLQGNPYDGHTLSNAITQVETLTAKTPSMIYCDAGYRGHDYKGAATVKVVRKLPKRATRTQKNWLKRRAAIEPVIGHVKHDHRMARNYLKGVEGNQANAILAAAGYNLAKLLAWFYCAWIIVRAIKRSRPEAAPVTALSVLL
jgi:IS5 family transposase